LLLGLSVASVDEADEVTTRKNFEKTGVIFAKEMRSNEDVIDKIMYPRCSRFIIEKRLQGASCNQATSRMAWMSSSLDLDSAICSN